MTNDAPLVQQIEALLFYEGGSLSLKTINEHISSNPEAVSAALDELEAFYTGRGVVLIRTTDELSIRVAPQCTTLIEQFQKEALTKDIGPASLEVLSILLYRGASSQADIDAIRGVNSAVSLRNLRMRGLVSTTGELSKKTYTVTAEALAHLGVTSESGIPEQEKCASELAAFEGKMRGVSQEKTVEQHRAEE
jgi:chromosome segregation and condensation protein ScpB